MNQSVYSESGGKRGLSAGSAHPFSERNYRCATKAMEQAIEETNIVL